MYLKVFGITKIPLIWYCRPRILTFTKEETQVRIPLRRRTRNHLRSMYFGALAVGADVTGGFTAFMIAKESGHKMSFVFQDFEAKFLKRPDADVVFTCTDGLKVIELVNQAAQSGERLSAPVKVTACCPDISDELVATFTLTISLKVKK